MDKLARKVDIHHAAMQGSYFAGFSAIWGFGPVLLLYLGLSNSTLGVVTSLALVLPLLLQPALAALSDADSRWTSRRLALVLSLLTLAAAVVMTVSTGSKTVLVAAYAVIGVLLVSTSPFFNSMVMEYHLRGVNVNYGLGRGTGSTTYAIVALLLGFVLEKRAPTVILPVLLAALVLQIIAVWTFRYPLPPVPAAQEEEPPKVLGLWALLKKYPAFPVMLMGCALLQGGHNACNTYMIHIVDKVGAGESLMGVVLAVSAFMELPAMTLFSRMRQKLSLRGMFLLCAAAFVPAGQDADAAVRVGGAAIFRVRRVPACHRVLRGGDAGRRQSGQGTGPDPHFLQRRGPGGDDRRQRYAGGSGGRERHAAVQRGCCRGGTAGGGLCHVRVF